MVAVSGQSYPIGHITKLAEHAQIAYEERLRNRSASVQKLQKLDIIEKEEAKEPTRPVRRSSKRAQMAQK